MSQKESTNYITGSGDKAIRYWQDLACANRKVAEDAQAQRDKAREDALEDAARVCEGIYPTAPSKSEACFHASNCAAAIRAMKKECGK